MLKIYFGDMKDAIYNTSMFFDNVYLDNWLSDEMSKQMIKDIDKAVILGPQAVESKALGVIPVTQLSGGTKTLLLIRHMPKKVFNASTCGDNCAKWILRIAKEADQDITINLHHMMDFGNRNFEIQIINNGITVHNMKEMILKAGSCLTAGEQL